MPLTKSQSDATFLRMLANEFEMFKHLINRATEGRFHFSTAALKIIAENIERSGYDDDAPECDAALDDVRERVYGNTLAHVRAKALAK